MAYCCVSILVVIVEYLTTVLIICRKFLLKNVRFLFLKIFDKQNRAYLLLCSNTSTCIFVFQIPMSQQYE